MFGIKENAKIDKPIYLITLLAKCYVYKRKLQSSMPVLTMFRNILKDRYNIDRYSSFILGKIQTLKYNGYRTYKYLSLHIIYVYIFIGSSYIILI